MDKERFVSWYMETFAIEPNDKQLIIDMLGNIVDYAKNNIHSLDGVAYFVSDITGNVSFEEACMFCDDSELTINGWNAKQNALKSLTEQDKGMNTHISYLYRDSSNYKQYIDVIVEGILTEEQVKEIMHACDCEEYFIPQQVGLPEIRFGEYSDDDHAWFELHESSFSSTIEPATESVTAQEMYLAFLNAKNHWDDTLWLTD